MTSGVPGGQYVSHISGIPIITCHVAAEQMLPKPPLPTFSFHPSVDMSFVLGPSDPFYQLMQPPPDETPAQATARRTRELDAQRTSDEIDEALRREHSIRTKKDRNVVKILLLGQSESGQWAFLAFG
jgi:hypothetical protein